MIGRPGDHSSRLARGELADPALVERLDADDPEGTYRRREFLTRTAMLAGSASLATLLPADQLVNAAARAARRPLPAPRDLPIDTFVVLMMENRSFDHYFGWHPTADARNNFTYPDGHGGEVSTHHLAGDFQGCGWEDPGHGWNAGRDELNGGKMDGWVAESDEFAAGYYLKDDVPFIPHAADAYTLYDRYFCSVLGPTWPNRHYMWSGQSDGHKGNGDIPEVPFAGLGDGLYTWETIMNRLLANGLSFRYYYCDLPFGAVYGRDTILNSAPIATYYLDAALGQLPDVCFVDPGFAGEALDGTSSDEHPLGDIRVGQGFMSDVVHAFIESPQYRRGAMFVNYDEWGGFFDHVVPPRVRDSRASKDIEEDFGQTGFRVPGVAISPYTRGGRVSHLQVTHESILKLISYRFRLGHLTRRHRFATNIGRSFDWKNPDFEPPELPDPASVLGVPCALQGSPTADAAAPHSEMRALETSGYLDWLGAKVYKGTPDEIFRQPDRIRRALRHAP